MAREVNVAVEIGHRDGILSAASLMVSGAAAADAVERTRRLPKLRVGLHVVLVDGRPTLPPENIPHLVDVEGRFRNDLPRLGFDIFARPAARRQLAAEIEAQFEAFRATGLPLDHVNAHRHFHLHPTVARLILSIGRRFGMKGLRVPIEPRAQLSGEAGRLGLAMVMTPWARLLAQRVRAAGLCTPDAVSGLAWSGAMTPDRLGRLLDRLPDGRTEIYLHPATANDFPEHAPGYRYTDELAALTSAPVVAAARRPDVRIGGYADF
jgi:hopanoid biosynthesis associated protein HpnK